MLIKEDDFYLKDRYIRILAKITAIILYAIAMSVVLALVYVGLSSLAELLRNYNFKDAVVFCVVVIFLYFIIKSSWHIIKIRIKYSYEI